MSLSLPVRVALGVVALLVLATVYLFQRLDYAGIFIMTFSDRTVLDPNVVFVINRTVRLVINDVACMALIFAVFQRRSYLAVAFYVFIFELLIVLPVYFAIKLSLEGASEISSPLLSFIHRLVVNPMLMIVLMAGFFYQRFWGRDTHGQR